MLAESKNTCLEVVYKVAESLKANVRLLKDGAQLTFDNCEAFFHYQGLEDDGLYVGCNYNIEAEFSPAYYEIPEEEQRVLDKTLEKLNDIKKKSDGAFYADGYGTLLYKPNVWLTSVPDARNLEVAVNTLVSGANQFLKLWNGYLEEVASEFSLGKVK